MIERIAEHKQRAAHMLLDGIEKDVDTLLSFID